MTHPAIVLNDVTITYGKRMAVRDVSATFAEGSLTAVAGPNGAGKSTLLKAIAGILKPAKGRIHIDPCFVGSIAYMPQSAQVRRDFPITVLQAVCSGYWRLIGETGAIGADLQVRARDALSRVGLENFENRQLDELSGGQFQRVLFARAILTDARIILLDEPFTAVDGDTTARLIQIILDWHREGRTVVCVMHDLMLIRKYFPESFVLAGKCMGRGHTHAMFEQKLLSFDLDMAELDTGEDNSAKLHHHIHADGEGCGHDHH